jgi:hypothetical protein
VIETGTDGVVGGASDDRRGGAKYDRHNQTLRPERPKPDDVFGQTSSPASSRKPRPSPCSPGRSWSHRAGTIFVLHYLSVSSCPVVPLRSGHRIGKTPAMHVINNNEPALVAATGQLDARLIWIGEDDRGVELEIDALDRPDAVVVIHVMPTDLRR